MTHDRYRLPVPPPAEEPDDEQRFRLPPPAAAQPPVESHGDSATPVEPYPVRPPQPPSSQLPPQATVRYPRGAPGSAYPEQPVRVHGPGGGPGGPLRSALALGRELTVVVAVALILSLLIKTFLLQPFWIPSGSMNNTLVYGDRVIVSKLTPGVFDLQRGDVIVFTDPGGWLDEPVSHPGPVARALQFVGLYPAGDNHLIKRVIGLPGDQVKCCTVGGLISVNGVAIHEPYLHPGDPPSTTKFDITVPKGKVWVMGDHRSNSGDSRYHDDGTGRTGSVPEKDITGRAIAIVWPVDRITWLSNYPGTFAKVPHP